MTLSEQEQSPNQVSSISVPDKNQSDTAQVLRGPSVFNMYSLMASKSIDTSSC